MAEGKIKRLTGKSFGFIEAGDGNEVFFHMSNLADVKFEELREGQKVTYDEVEGPKGLSAENVKPAD